MTPEQLGALVVQPGDHVLLIPRRPLTDEHAEALRAVLPAALRGRVIVVDGFDVRVVRAGVDGA